MAGAQQTYPKWLLACKQHITDSKEWDSFLKELHDAIQQQLTQSHVQYFSDLSEPEKELFMERATQAIKGGTVYNGLCKKVSVITDQSLNEDVSRQLLEESPMDTKTDLVIESAEEGALSLLKKWPDMKNKLYICLNQPLPLHIRQLTWRLYLSNTKVRKHYIDQLNTNPRAAISMYDYDISQKCETLLNSEPTFNDLRGSVGIFYGMKATLSYYHSILKTKNRLRDVEHLLAVPFMDVASTNISRREPPPGRVVALIVEEFMTFLGSRPGFVVDSGSDDHNDEVIAFIDKVAKLLQRRHPEVSRMITEKFVPVKEKIVATETGSYALLTEGLMTLIRPMIRSVFVTYLKMDTLLYIWDQYMIGVDTPGFNNEWLAIVTVTLLGLIKEKLKEATSPAHMEKILKAESCKLTVPQFQYEIKLHYYKDLFSLLTKDQKAAMPILDPTQAQHPPWRHWYNDVIPPHTKPQDRRKAREEREAERDRQLQQQKDVETARKEQDQRERRDEEETFLKMAAVDRQRVEEERIALQDQLDEERRRRIEAEKRAQAEIDQLKLELAAMKHTKPPSRAPSTNSMSSNISRLIIAPPPSRASKITIEPLVVLPPVEEARTPTPAQTPTEQRNKIIIDFLRRAKHGVDKVAHAEGNDKSDLDRETEGYLRQNVRDIKNAQKEVFGKTLDPGEFDKMPPKKQQDTSEKMIKLMQKWREERRAKELAKKR
ncbi:uncharacterized protein LOC127710461 isoform X4 [Mytilus californianus]|uniref:uncharacterized protein LOC127710461 isoform X4 n=1 Tax=Mytilus californianus TaxID=6549 RepID=UPI0022484538|nr:uncharacterized protein LOC127710461 isoform X4 [Mytilus californianus]